MTQDLENQCRTLALTLSKVGTIIPEGQFLKVELTPASKSDPQNVIWSSTLSLNLTSVLTPNQTLGLSHNLAYNRHYCCLLKHSLLLPFYQNSNFVWIIFYPHHDYEVYCTKQENHILPTRDWFRNEHVMQVWPMRSEGETPGAFLFSKRDTGRIFFSFF